MPLVPYALTRPFLFGLDPERAHELTLDAIATLQRTPLQCLWQQARVADPVTVAGLRFPNRIGLAAGLDKNGRCIDGFGAMGFGFIEVGTVTPLGQPGNPRPRMFRLPQADALINRLGFNNEGLAAFLANVRQARSFRAGGGVLTRGGGFFSMASGGGTGGGARRSQTSSGGRVAAGRCGGLRIACCQASTSSRCRATTNSAIASQLRRARRGPALQFMPHCPRAARPLLRHTGAPARSHCSFPWTSFL